MRGVPNEMVAGDRIREATVRTSPILEGIVHNFGGRTIHSGNPEKG